MDEKTRALLQASIEHHERNLEAESVGDTRVDGNSCPLCKEFFASLSPEGYHCVGCPVREKTGVGGCVGTPWSLVHATRKRWAFEGTYTARYNFRKAERAEIDFLKSLLPEKKIL